MLIQILPVTGGHFPRVWRPPVEFQQPQALQLPQALHPAATGAPGAGRDRRTMSARSLDSNNLSCRRRASGSHRRQIIMQKLLPCTNEERSKE